MNDRDQPSGRRFQRIELSARATVLAGVGKDPGELPGEHPGELLDICLGGVLIRPADGTDWAKPEERVRVNLTLDGGVTIDFEGEVAHVGDAAIGIRTERLDIASFARLKRLVELNLGDADLLERELEALL